MIKGVHDVVKNVKGIHPLKGCIKSILKMYVLYPIPLPHPPLCASMFRKHDYLHTFHFGKAILQWKGTQKYKQRETLET